ncbi:LacI family transcriptional regulator [Xaviernesmea oryzae]|uniref:LacI family transcriptional regulator n=1 Tax=Xaviernesmea oryzae TaxID=464029 RepID=A0A1Q9B3R0_9HYPH|nr:substrate-binding domain-containing protein [Xaviernesmea oryzae]OLP62691.1 LacI family transcriptional regulator [Xaviernesmea oryzae]SEM36860.1 transcriptional regulator, LacI family [Xaviernesmea oryzae]
MSKVTLKDLAAAAGVGTATVERVMNGRGGVRPETVERVLLTATRLGYRRIWPEIHRELIRIEVVLVRPETLFYTRMNHAFERIAASLGHGVAIHRTFARENDPEDFARYIAKPKQRRSALIVVAPEHKDVVRNLREVAATGIPVIQIMTRPAADLPYVGIDNYAAGRMAAYFMSRMLSAQAGSFVALCHSGAYENHKQRIRGFSAYLEEHAKPKQHFTEVMFDLDDELAAMELLQTRLDRSRDVIGVYTAGGDNRAVAKLLSDRQSRGIFWVGHELSDHSRTWLKQGVMTLVLDQVPEVQARRSVDLALKALGLMEAKVDTEPVRFLTITSENL